MKSKRFSRVKHFYLGYVLSEGPSQTTWILIIIMLSIAFLIAYDHYFITGVWFEPEDFLHHENFIAIILACIVGIFLHHKLNKK